MDLDAFLQMTATAAPTGFRRPVAAFTAAAPPAPPDSFMPPPSVPFGERAQVLLRLGPAPELRDAGVPLSISSRLGSRRDVARWLETLRRFARTKAATEALAAERRELAESLADFQARLSSAAPVSAIESYTGLPMPGPHRLILSPFHDATGVANVIADREDGSVEVTSLFGPAGRDGALDWWSARVPGTLWHEEAHGITDPLATAWSARIERARPADPAAVCYGEWRQCVREHVVRAVMLRLIELRLGRAAFEEQLAFEEPGRFRWLGPMLELLRTEYERDRRRWPTLADYYPRLLDALGPEPAAGGPEFLPEKETPEARARVVRLEAAARPLMRDGEAAGHLRRAAALAAAKPDRVRAGAPEGARKSAAVTARGVEAFQRGDKVGALALFESALAQDPADAEAEMSRALILELAGRSEEALAGYGRAAESARRRPETFPPHVLADALGSRGRLLLASGRLEEARRALEAALSAAPQAWQGRAEAEAGLARCRR